jgi:K+-sensing histidine kinase KdpD
MPILDAATGRLPDDHRLLLLLWVVLSILISFIDYVTGPFIQFPFLFILPVVFSTWYNGRAWGIGYAIVLPLVRLYFNTIWSIPWTMVEGSINAVIRISVLLLLAYLVDKVAERTKTKEKEVKLLEGLLPICASCKKIRDENREWQVLEAYITRHSQAKFSHGVCPDCAKRLYGVNAASSPENAH